MVRQEKENAMRHLVFVCFYSDRKIWEAMPVTLLLTFAPCL